MGTIKVIILYLLLFNASSGIAWAFPEMVRHGYTNCTSCHVSPTGGGVLTQYGRELSREILSTWGRKNPSESKFAYGLVTPPDWLNVMGMYRGVYAYQNTPFIQQSKYIYMQGDIEASAVYQKLTLAAALGYQNMANQHTVIDHMISRRHYLMYQVTDEFSLRGGRFYPSFGINTPDHVIPTKRNLGWDEGQETYNLEAAWIGSQWNFYATGVFGRPDQSTLHRETGASVTGSSAITDHHKVGVSYFYGDGLQSTRHVAGPFGIFGFTPHFFLLSEFDMQQQSDKSGDTPSRWGVVNYQRLDYEVTQGLHFYLTQDYGKLNFKDRLGQKNSFGLGTQFFPRPHFEINVSWQKQKVATVSEAYTDFAWLMVNVYL